MAEEAAKSKLDEVKEKIAEVFSRIGKLTRLQRLLICVVTIALIGGGYYYFFYAPRQEELVRVEQELKTQAQKLNTYMIKARTLKKWEKKMAEVEEQFYIAMKALPDKKELPSLLTGVSKAGSRAGLKFLLFQPAPEVNREFYMEIPLSIRVSGSYHQITDFFFQVARLNRIVNIKNMDMKRAPKIPGMISMNCNAVTYMFKELQDIGPNKKKKKG